MGGVWRAGAARIVFATLLGACASGLAACSLVLGLDSGKALEDADASPDALAPDATSDSSGADGPEADDSMGPGPASDGGMKDGAADARSDAAAAANGGDACTPDPNWCDVHCGSGPDNCG